jgi:spore coat polysaccharide biosynthesis protein SpsF (cytidylyltransferase family)
MEAGCMSRCIAFIQARMSSSRFPGKVLEPIGEMPAIEYMVRRVRRCRTLEAVVVVTSTDPSDDRLADTLDRAGIPSFRGDLHDVLRRFSEAARAFDAHEVVRLTGDCPLIDPEVVDDVVMLRRAQGADYASNVDPPTYPDGLDCECFTRDALDAAERCASAGPEREHVTLWMRSVASRLRRVNHRCIVDASHLRLTVDYPDDLVAVRGLVSALGPNDGFGLFDLLRVLERRRDILDLNPHARNESLAH